MTQSSAAAAAETPPPLLPTKFLVCVSGSDNSASRVALRLACLRARKCGGLVDMLHVIEPLSADPLMGIGEKLREESRARAEALMQELCAEAHATAGITPSILLREGNVAEEIVKAAMEDCDAHMLVLGVTQGSARQGKLVAWLAAQMGESLLVPLLLVPGNLTDQQIDELR
jgi:nucleotide-binding universal stress UspA family protein